MLCLLFEIRLISNFKLSMMIVHAKGNMHGDGAATDGVVTEKEDQQHGSTVNHKPWRAHRLSKDVVRHILWQGSLL